MIPNGELSCAAVALLVKPVRVGVSLRLDNCYGLLRIEGDNEGWDDIKPST